MKTHRTILMQVFIDFCTKGDYDNAKNILDCYDAHGTDKIDVEDLSTGADYAAYRGYYDIVKMVIARKEMVKFGDCLLCVIIRGVNQKTNTPKTNTTKTHIEFLKSLLQDPRSNNCFTNELNYPLLVAIENDDTDAALLLIDDERIDVNFRNGCAIWWTTYNFTLFSKLFNHPKLILTPEIMTQLFEEITHSNRYSNRYVADETCNLLFCSQIFVNHIQTIKRAEISNNIWRAACSGNALLVNLIMNTPIVEKFKNSKFRINIDSWLEKNDNSFGIYQSMVDYCMTHPMFQMIISNYNESKLQYYNIPADVRSKIISGIGGHPYF